MSIFWPPTTYVSFNPRPALRPGEAAVGDVLWLRELLVSIRARP